MPKKIFSASNESPYQGNRIVHEARKSVGEEARRSLEHFLAFRLQRSMHASNEG